MENLKFAATFEKENKVQDITLDMLRDTHIEYDAMGRPMKQIRHADLFDNIINDDTFSAFNLTDKVHNLRYVRTRTALVDNSNVGVI